MFVKEIKEKEKCIEKDDPARLLYYLSLFHVFFDIFIGRITFNQIIIIIIFFQNKNKLKKNQHRNK